MWCSDPYVDLLKRHAYCLVRLPRGNIKPTQVLAQAGKDLHPIGALSTVFVAGSASMPTVRENIPVTEMQGASTGRLGASMGLSILGDVIQALGGDVAGLDGAYQRARRITFKFSKVQQDSIDIASLDRFLSHAEIDPSSKQIKRMLDSDNLYITTATLKSNTLTVEAHGEKDAELEVNATLLQQMVGSKVTIHHESQALSKLVYTGNEPLVFGFQAVRLIYHNGIFTALRPSSLRLAMRAITDEDTNPDVHGYLQTEGAFVCLL